MPRFNVGIHGDDLDRASDALQAGRISAGRTVGGGFGGAVDVLVAHIDAETPDAALARVREQLPPDGGYTLGPTEAPPVPAKFFKQRRSSRLPADAREYRALELRRVLVAEPQTGDQLRVQAVHLYEDAMRVDYVLPLGMDHDGPEGGWHPTRMLLTDDLGTEYYPGGGGFGGRGGLSGEEVTHGHNWFAPAVPDAAGRLTVATLFGDVTFDL